MKPQKKRIRQLVHILYVVSIMYAGVNFLMTSRQYNMLNRRLWAYEFWILFTFYIIFLYIFMLDAREVGELQFRKPFRIRRSITLRTTKSKIIQFFDQISQSPDKYSFKTHKGVFIDEGYLQKVGSRFHTVERFAGIPVRLNFVVTKVDPDKKFGFRVTGLLEGLNIYGSFSYKTISQNKTRLTLAVRSPGGTFFQNIILGFVFLGPLRVTVAGQLRKELKFIRRQIRKITE